ncbi:MAG: 4'-phosphopantetheinyl transferase superfamily protein [Gemmatimonadota bacterium]
MVDAPVPGGNPRVLGPGWSLPEDEIHLWRLPLAPDARWGAALQGVLTEADRADLARFRRPEDARRRGWARGAVRWVLGTLSGTAPTGLDFEIGPRGKPSLPGSGLEFNLSHTREWLLLAVARGRRVGVDLEAERPLKDPDGLARVSFTPAEREALAAAPPSERPARFLRVWARKEALAKALGEGLAAFPRFTATVEGEARLLELDGDPTEAARWRLLDLAAVPGHQACLAAEGRGWHLVWHTTLP